MTQELEQGDIVLCTVERIAGTIVFVKIDKTGQEASIILSEIAPGRIRNLREYVVPKKKIVCKVLRIVNNQIHLSLRRVSQKEQKQVKEEFKQEQSYKNILKTILEKDAEKLISKIQEKNSLFDFFEQAKKDSKELEKLISKKDSKKILEIISKQKQKKIILKKQIKLTSQEPDGLSSIKKIFKKIKGAKIKYISAGKYSLILEDKDAKSADKKINSAIKEIETQAKKNNMEFSVKEK